MTLQGSGFESDWGLLLLAFLFIYETHSCVLDGPESMKSNQRFITMNGLLNSASTQEGSRTLVSPAVEVLEVDVHAPPLPSCFFDSSRSRSNVLVAFSLAALLRIA